jgi:hypothetical protein
VTEKILLLRFSKPLTMKKLLLLLPFLLTHLLTSYAQHHDTITVQTFTFGSPQDAWFALPPDTTTYEKILMHYKLKCNPAQSPACGEWDYLTYTYLYDHTGVLDSTLYTAPSFSAGGASPDTFSYMNTTTYSYLPHFQQYIVYTDTLSTLENFVGQAQSLSEQTFYAALSDARSQYIWTADELTAAGVVAGEITGIGFNIGGTPGSELRNLRIRMKHSALDSLMPTVYETSGFETVYLHNTTFPSTGNNRLNFITPFIWNGTSNIVIDFSFDNSSNGAYTEVRGMNTGWNSGLFSADADNYLDFEGPDYVQVPADAFTELDSAVTIMFWQYGDPAVQPQANMIFEGYSADNQRVLNVHLPWDNGNIYWDAGNASGFDRIELAAQTAQYEGKWNHWAFTKNVATGSMKIYLNGVLFHSGTGMIRPMAGVTNFKIGSAAPGNLNYDGYIDEFSFWNTELDLTTIQEWMYKDVNGTHPDFSELAFYYPFNETSGTVATDASGNGYHGALVGLPARHSVAGPDIFRNLISTQQRPFLIVTQNEYQSYIDSVLVIDTVENPVIQILVYADSANPLVATDSILAWETYYTYTFDNEGAVVDSTFVTPDESLFLSIWEYYGTPFEVIDRYEIGRFITPYGFGLDLHDGFTWVYDVTDFEPLLHDSVHLSAGNWQELLDMKFEYIVGTPAREVLNVENIWNGDFALSNFDTRVTAKTLMMNPAASSFNLKSTASGHGWDNPSNCAEFCPKMHTIKVNGNSHRTFQLWKKCATNPLYPQGGTWLIDRAAWCPGAPVDVYNTDLTNVVTAGDSATIDYDIQSNPYGNYVFEAQLISYGANNFTIDAAVDDIISPSNKDEHYRENPICVGPKIKIKNNGTSALTSLTITYGVAGGTSSSQNWTGNLGFQETEVVELGALDWTGITGGQGVFEVSLSNVNGNEQYLANNSMRSTFTVPEIREHSFVVWTKSNAAPYENSWTLKDENGTVLYSRDDMAANTTYKDTVNLPNGCFVLELIDEGEDGMDWWAGLEGGYIRLKSATSNATLENFDSKWTIAGSAAQYRGDFGTGFKYHFTTGWALPVEENTIQSEVFVYPNPTQGLITVDLLLTKNEDAQIEVFDIAGQLIYNTQLAGSDFYSHKIDLSSAAKGVYVVTVKTETTVVTRKVVID